MFKVIYIYNIYSYAKVKQKSTKQKKKEKKKGICTCSSCPRKQKDQFLGLHQIQTFHPSPLSACASSALSWGSTQEVNGVMASESLPPAKASHCCFVGWRHTCSACCDSHKFPSLWHRTLGARLGRPSQTPTPGTAVDLSHFEACNKHTKVQLARTMSKMLGETLLQHVCMCIFFFLNVIHMCVNWSIIVAGSLPYFKCTDIFLPLCSMDCCVKYNIP